ncbi:paramyosin-like isoform X2 [Planococcus citri]|uniref:paramyosin-like isoform X2 n=1 Tax=Planococcus citri TaxID=170843 RepID=UPI0031F8E3FD
MSFNVEMHKRLMRRIDVLWKLRDDPDLIKVKILRDHLLSTYDKMVAYETKIEENSDSIPNLPTWLNEVEVAHIKTIQAKIKLEQTLSSSKSTSPTETKVGDTSNPTKQSESGKNSDLQIRKQRFLIKRIESLEILDDICAIKAEVLHNHLSQLYDSFISNQIQIEAGTDDDTNLDNQQKITTDIQRKVIDFQTKLKKIMQSIASTSSTESNISIDRSIQPTPIDTTANLDSLFQKRESFIKRISLLEPKEDLSPEKAEAMYNHLDSLYESFNANQTEIESRVSGPILASQLEISEQIQNKMIKLRAKLKKIFAPIKLSSSSTQSEALQSEQTKSLEFESSLRSTDLKLSSLTDLLESRSSRDETESNLNDIFTHLEDTSELSEDIFTKIVSLETTLNESIDANKHHEKNTLDKLDRILEFNGRFEQDYKTRALQSEQIKSPELESSLRSIELKLTNLTDLLESRSSREETESNTSNDIDTDLEDDSKDIKTGIICLLATMKQYEKNVLDKLNKILKFNEERHEEDYKTKALQSEKIKSSESESSLPSIKLKLSNSTDLLESQSSRDETKSNINDLYYDLEDNSEIFKDIQNKIISIQTTLKEFIHAAEDHEENTHNKSDEMQIIISMFVPMDD